jgi:hypothetical protein
VTLGRLVRVAPRQDVPGRNEPELCKAFESNAIPMPIGPDDTLSPATEIVNDDRRRPSLGADFPRKIPNLAG